MLTPNASARPRSRSSCTLRRFFCALLPGLLAAAPFAQADPPASLPIEHVIVVMQENRSFDHYFGALNLPEYYGAAVDGLDRDTPVLLAKGQLQIPAPVVQPYRYDPAHSWRSFHVDWNGGLNNGFRKLALSYFSPADLPYYYALASTFAISDRYFASALAPTFPNRYFLWCGTAFGRTNNTVVPPGWSQRTIFDAMNDAGVSWKYYADGNGYLTKFNVLYAANKARQFRSDVLLADLGGGGLPAVSFVDADAVRSEHPPYLADVGQRWVSNLVAGLMNSPYWANTALFFVYDECGGFYDHVPPPAVVLPDNITPVGPPPQNWTFDRLGFRVPFVLVSAFAKRHYVSHVVNEHCSILKFIETRFGLPALTARDAAADDMSDLFDFAHPDFSLPALPPP